MRNKKYALFSYYDEAFPLSFRGVLGLEEVLAFLGEAVFRHSARAVAGMSFGLLVLMAFSQPVYSGIVAQEVIHLEGELDQPSDVAVSERGKIYVLDGANHRVVVYSSQGKKTGVFGGEALLLRPMGVAIWENHLFIADSGNHQIVVFNLDGEYIKSFPLSGPLAPEPTSLSVANGVITWSDRANHRVCRNSSRDGAVIKCWGERGGGEGDFEFPFQVKIDSDGYLYVVDVLNGRVQMFDFQGRYFTQLGRFGLEVGELYRPNGLAIYEGDQVLVSDAYFGTISVFEEGRFTGFLKDKNGDVLRFSTPVGLTVDQHRLYVADSKSERIAVFLLESVDAERVPKSTQASMKSRNNSSQKDCAMCHLSWAPDYQQEQGGDQGPYPVASERMCYSCHHGVVVDSRKQVGQGWQHSSTHHLREKPTSDQKQTNRKNQQDEVPDEFPLLPSHRVSSQPLADDRSSLTDGDRLSCGTCHTPHTQGGNETTLYPSHQNPWMRVLNNDGDLCIQCHASKLHDPTRDNEADVQLKRADEAVRGVNHPIGIFLKAPPQAGDVNYARSEQLHQGLPLPLISSGGMLGREKQLLCQSCHQVHGANNSALTVLDSSEAALCIECHERHTASSLDEARRKGVHPVNIKLETPIEIEGKQVDKITCLTCHSVHNGQPGSSLLRLSSQEGQLCEACHEDQLEVVGSDHDLPEHSGVCRACHTMHQGNVNTPFLYNGEYKPYQANEQASGRDRICLDCHGDKGGGNEVVEHFSHPSQALILRSDPKVMPLLDAKNEVEEFGKIACITCHNPHRWSPGNNFELIENETTANPNGSPLTNKDGSVLNSFLRVKGVQGTFCVNCHGLQSQLKYQYYHDEMARDIGVDYFGD